MGRLPQFTPAADRGADIAHHSQRNAITGSTLVARRAGSRQASKATLISSIVIKPNVKGSIALTPWSRSERKRVSIAQLRQRHARGFIARCGASRQLRVAIFQALR
jgi:hypothetical protein